MKNAIEFVTRTRGKFAHLDPYGIMHNEYYQGYFMDHRMNGLRENLGWDLAGLQKLPIRLIVKSVTINYMKPVRGDIELEIRSKVNSFNGILCEISCQMYSLEKALLSECHMTVVAVDSKTLKPCDWPEDIKTLFYQNEEILTQ